MSNLLISDIKTSAQLRRGVPWAFSAHGRSITLVFLSCMVGTVSSLNLSLPQDRLVLRESIEHLKEFRENPVSLSNLYFQAMSRVLVENEPSAPAGIPTPHSDAPSELVAKVGDALNLIAWGGTAAGVAGVLITGAMMAISHKRGETSEHMSRLGMVLGGCVLISVAGPLVTFFF